MTRQQIERGIGIRKLSEDLGANKTQADKDTLQALKDLTGAVKSVERKMGSLSIELVD